MNFNEIIRKLLQLDNTNNIYRIDLQSDIKNSIEVNIIYDNYELISDEIWDYILSLTTDTFRIDNYGIDQEIPAAKQILYIRGE